MHAITMKPKKKIDWKKRESELTELLDKYRKTNGYDCVVPGSGGKDSAYTAHILKYKYGMNPLTVTWAPHLYTDIGWKNFDNWIKVGGLDNILFTPNGRVHRLLTRLAFKNLCNEIVEIFTPIPFYRRMNIWNILDGSIFVTYPNKDDEL